MWNLYPCPIAAILAVSLLPMLETKHAARRCADAANDRQTLRVRMAPGGIDPAVIAQARAEVDAIWRRYQIDVTWEPRWEHVDHQAPPDLWVQFVDGHLPSTTGHGQSAIASIPFYNGVPAHHVRVSTAAAMALLALPTQAWRGSVRPLADGPSSLRRDALGRIIGRALAHEIGHYLLASPKHADRGLMRAVLSPQDLVRPGVTFLTLRDADVQALRVSRLANCEAAR